MQIGQPIFDSKKIKNFTKLPCEHVQYFVGFRSAVPGTETEISTKNSGPMAYKNWICGQGIYVTEFDRKVVRLQLGLSKMLR